MNFTLSPDQIELQSAARDFARAELPGIAAELERDNRPPSHDLIKRFAEINPGFDDMRGGARLAAAAENLIRHAAKANSTIQRFRVEIGVDRSNHQPQGVAP